MSFPGPKPPAAGSTGFPAPHRENGAENASATAPVIPRNGERLPGKSLYERQPSVVLRVPPQMSGAIKAEVSKVTRSLEQSRDRLAVLEGQKFLHSQLDSLSQQLNHSTGAGTVNYRLVFVPRGKPPISVIPPEPGGADVQARLQTLRQQAKPLVEQAKAYFSEDRLQELNRQLVETKQSVRDKFVKLEELQVQPTMASVLPAPVVLDTNRWHRDLRPVLSEHPKHSPSAPDDEEFVLIPQPPVTSTGTPSGTDHRGIKTRQWLNFYRSGGRIDGQRHTLAQIRKMNPTQLEEEHRYIQLLFPNEHASPHNREAPLLTLDMVEQIRNDPALQNELLTSLDQMLEFWGLSRNGNRVSIIPGRAASHAKWNAEFDHNHKRITRVLNCLMACGYEKCAENLEAELQHERVSRGQPVILHWKVAVGKA